MSESESLPITTKRRFPEKYSFNVVQKNFLKDLALNGINSLYLNALFPHIEKM